MEVKDLDSILTALKSLQVEFQHFEWGFECLSALALYLNPGRKWEQFVLVSGEVLSSG